MSKLSDTSNKPSKQYPDVIKYDKFLDAVKMRRGDPWDIEDLVKHGKRTMFCPYFMAKAIKNEVDIVFLPYNYLLDTNIRDQLDINIKLGMRWVLISNLS